MRGLYIMSAQDYVKRKQEQEAAKQAVEERNLRLRVRICARCKEEKSFDDFHKSKGRKYGINQTCISCRGELRRKPKVDESDLPTRVCKTCGVEKKVNAFTSQGSGYYKSHCKDCFSIRQSKTPEGVTTKQCNGCDKELPFSEFHKYKQGKYGIQNQCKLCLKTARSEKARKKREEKEAFLAQQTTKVCSRCKEEKPFDSYYKGNGTHGVRSQCIQCFSDIAKEKYPERKKEMADYGEWYYENNREEINAKSNQWNKDNRERKNENQRNWRKNNIHKVREDVNRRRADRLDVESESIPEGVEKYLYDRQNGLCYICKDTLDDGQPLETDHWIALSKGGPHKLSNLRRMHRHCNRKKSAKLPGDVVIIRGKEYVLE